MRFDFACRNPPGIFFGRSNGYHGRNEWPRSVACDCFPAVVVAAFEKRLDQHEARFWKKDRLCFKIIQDHPEKTFISWCSIDAKVSGSMRWVWVVFLVRGICGDDVFLVAKKKQVWTSECAEFSREWAHSAGEALELVGPTKWAKRGYNPMCKAIYRV